MLMCYYKKYEKSIQRDSPNESQVEAIIETESGVIGTFALNGESLVKDVGYFNIYGKEGMIKLPNSNEFTGDAVLIPQMKRWEDPAEEIVLPGEYSIPDNARGIGIADMVDAIEHGRQPLANKELAYHVLDIILTMEKSSRSGRFERVKSGCDMRGRYLERVDF